MTIAPATVDHLVIGGGPAGSTVALRLAAAGRQVTLIEKEREPLHKVCGEFLSREAIGYLTQIGISPREQGAVDLRTVALSSGERVVEASLPFHALSLSRRTLDAALLSRAQEKGCCIRRGIAVKALAPDGGSWIATLSNGESLRATNIFLATGKHDLRGFARPPGKQSDLVGFKLHWRLSLAQIDFLRERMELYLFPGGYGGLSLVENDAANLCLVVRRSRFRLLGGWAELLAAILDGNRHLRQLLRGAEPLWPHPLAISPIPYGYLAGSEQGLWCIGDQAAVIPSFTGDGISIALHSAWLAAEMHLSGKSVAEFNSTLRGHLRRPMILATWLSRAAVTDLGRCSALVALSLFPNAMRSIAAATRIPQRALPPNQNADTESAYLARQNA
jgi:flavin-dependent dehydrogenase